MTRPYWWKKQNLKCFIWRENSAYKENNCILRANNCIKQLNGECVCWEKIYQCYPKQLSEKDVNSLAEIDSSIWANEPFEPSRKLPQVMTSLAVFDEMKKELQELQASDAREVSLFAGTIQQCSKSVASDLMYDCCFQFDGFAKEMKLAKCTADEIALAEHRKKWSLSLRW